MLTIAKTNKHHLAVEMKERIKSCISNKPCTVLSN